MLAAFFALPLLPYISARAVIYGDEKMNLTAQREGNTTGVVYDEYIANIPLPCVAGCAVNIVGYLFCQDNSTTANCTTWCNAQTYAEWTTCIDCIVVEGGEDFMNTTPQQVLDNTNAFCRASGGTVNTLTSITDTATTTAPLTQTLTGVPPGTPAPRITPWDPLASIATRNPDFWRDLDDWWQGSDGSSSYPATRTYGPAAETSGAANRTVGSIGVAGLSLLGTGAAVLVGSWLAVF